MADKEPGISISQAGQVLKIRAMTLEECADEIELDRPDLARKWRQEAGGLRAATGHSN